MTLKQAKDKVAKGAGYENFAQLVQTCETHEMESLFDKAAKLYAKEKSTAAVQKAIAVAKESPYPQKGNDGTVFFSVLSIRGMVFRQPTGSFDQVGTEIKVGDIIELDGERAIIVMTPSAELYFRYISGPMCPQAIKFMVMVHPVRVVSNIDNNTDWFAGKFNNKLTDVKATA